MKRKAFTLFEAITVLVIIGVLTALLFSIFAPRWDSQKPPCAFNLKQIGLGFLQYAQDYDAKFPPLNNGSLVMNMALTPYIGEDEASLIFQCPLTWGNAIGRTDYFYNAQLAGVSKTKITRASAIILSGEGKDDQNASYHLSQLPTAWRTDEKSPVWRHLDGANYGFVDGHVKWYQAKRIFGARDAATPTFEVK